MRWNDLDGLEEHFRKVDGGELAGNKGRWASE
jgi:hypothetical protein